MEMTPAVRSVRDVNTVYFLLSLTFTQLCQYQNQKTKYECENRSVTRLQKYQLSLQQSGLEHYDASWVDSAGEGRVGSQVAIEPVGKQLLDAVARHARQAQVGQLSNAHFRLW